MQYVPHIDDTKTLICLYTDEQYGEFGGADAMAPSDCAPKSVGTQNSPTYFARRLAIAGLQSTAVMMTRARIYHH
jgi:hypothetical protein